MVRYMVERTFQGGLGLPVSEEGAAAAQQLKAQAASLTQAVSELRTLIHGPSQLVAYPEKPSPPASGLLDMSKSNLIHAGTMPVTGLKSVGSPRGNGVKSFTAKRETQATVAELAGKF
mgnify:CR=1 FL=1